MSTKKQHWKWPATVPILEPGDVCMVHIDDGAGAHCAIGWFAEALGVRRNPHSSSDPRYKVVEEGPKGKAFHDAYMRAARYLGLQESTCSPHINRAHAIYAVNDHCKDPAIRARAVNIAWALLGYTVGNPEAKTAREIKRADRKKRAKAAADTD